MTDHCTYCGESLPDNEYEDHLRREHADELTTIDKRRLNVSSENSSRRNIRRRNVALYTGVAVVLVLFVLGYSTVFLGSESAASSAVHQPDISSEIHEHGTIAISIDDDAVAFDDPQYIERDGCFHFHDSDGAEVWHTHCEDVTIEYALETLEMDVTTDQFVVDGETFTEGDGDSVVVAVNGEAVDPQTYVLEGVESVEDASAGGGDNVEIVVESGA
ncbi:hypothetical protein [Halostagnicola sp. A-GB9-2]|uniref:hypothetical protein n=1 Tax=Halostagnicola sp. A-GB9-2 TaxID=3048066 RepID=UPI0024BFB2ED|nr:hypothetical protein [Halostagnicola sp. A-GB9-2]MDJ1433175.1 hypothetical protein [Halostagnicola sp. A-GB9-2]